MSQPSATPPAPAPPIPVPRLRQKSRAVVEYHHDEERPGKPMWLVIPGALVAIVALLTMIALAYEVWFKGAVSGSAAVPLFAVLGAVYIGAVFAFSYGYELYDMRKALRKTAFIVFLGLAIVVVAAVLFAMLKENAHFSSSKGGSAASASGSASATAASTSAVASTDSGAVGWFPGIPAPASQAPSQPATPAVLTCPACGFQFPDQGNLKCPKCRADLFGPMPPSTVPPSAQG